MRILLTNDDGINAHGLTVLQKIARDFAGPLAEIWTVAPAFEQSGVGHCINYTRPTMLAKLDTHHYAAEGSPADCVLAGIHEVLNDRLPDLILSGVNRGNNSAENALYSGTLGGAIEGALQGVTSIAMSQYFGPDNRDTDEPFEAAIKYGAQIIRNILAHDPEDQQDYRLFYNVNFPPVPAIAVKGTRVTRQGFRRGTSFTTEPFEAPNGRRFLWIKGGDQRRPTADGTDAAANLDGYISVTPMRADFTDYAHLETLKAIE